MPVDSGLVGINTRKDRGRIMNGIDDQPRVYQSSIKEGWITKQGRSFVPTWKRRYFVVVENRIEYYADSARTVQKGTYQLDAETEVEDMTGSTPNLFLVTGKTSGKMYCKVDPGEDIYDWMAKIQSAIPFAVLKPSSQPYDGEGDYDDPMFTGNMPVSSQKDGRPGNGMSLWNRLRGRKNGNMSKQETLNSPAGFASNTNDIESWVSKLGGFMKNWKKRYMVLDGNTLKYYTDDTLKTQKNTFVIMSNTTINENPQGYECPKGEYMFSLLFQERELVVSVSDRELKDQWLRLLMIAQNGGVLPAHLTSPEEEDDYFTKPKKSNKHDNVANFNERLQADPTSDFERDSPAVSSSQKLSMPSPSPRNSFTDGFGAISPLDSNPKLLPTRGDSFSAVAPVVNIPRSPSQAATGDPFSKPTFAPNPPPVAPSLDTVSKFSVTAVGSNSFSSIKPMLPTPPLSFNEPSTNEASDPRQSSIEADGGSDPFGTRANKAPESDPFGSTVNKAQESDPFGSNVNKGQEPDPFAVAVRSSSVDAIRETSDLENPSSPSTPPTLSKSEYRCESRGSSVDEREPFQEPADHQGPRMMIPTPAEIERAMIAKKEQEQKERIRKEEEETKQRQEEERIEQEKQEQLERIANMLQASMQSKSKDVLAVAIKEAESGGFSNPDSKHYELFLSALDVSHELDEEVRRKDLEEAATAVAAERENLARASRESMRVKQQRDSLDIAPITLTLPSIHALQNGAPDSDDEYESEITHPTPPQPQLHSPIQQNQSSELISAVKQRVSNDDDLPFSSPEMKGSLISSVDDIKHVEASVSSVNANEVGEVDVSGMNDGEEFEQKTEEHEESEELEDTELSIEGSMRVNGQRRYVVLSESTLILYKEVEKVKKKKGIYTLHELSSVALDADADPLSFEIKDGKSPNNNLKLSFKKSSEVAEWIKALNKVIYKLNEASAEVRESALGVSMISRGSVMVDKKSLVKNIISPQAAMEKWKPNIRGFTTTNGTFAPMGPEYLQFGWLEVKLNTEFKWNRMFCTIEKKGDQKILTCYSHDDMKETLSSIFLVPGQRVEEAVLLGELAFVIKDTEKSLAITLKALDKNSKNEWCRTFDSILTEWD